MTCLFVRVVYSSDGYKNNVECWVCIYSKALRCTFGRVPEKGVEHYVLSFSLVLSSSCLDCKNKMLSDFGALTQGIQICTLRTPGTVADFSAQYPPRN